MCQLSRTLGTGSSIWMEEHLSNAANPDCGSSRGYTGMFRAHFWAAAAPGHKIQGVKLLLENASHLKQDLCFLSLSLVFAGQPEQLTRNVGWDQCHLVNITLFCRQKDLTSKPQASQFSTLQECAAFLSCFWYFSPMFSSVCRVQWLQCNRIQKISAYLWELSSCCLMNEDDVEQLDNRKYIKVHAAKLLGTPALL